MPPPGRRRSFGILPILSLVFLLFASEIHAAVIGIDIGTEYIKAALVKPGIPLEIVLTKDSKRKEGAAVAFKPASQDTQSTSAFPERLYGGDALSIAPRFPDNVYSNLKPLLGSLSDSRSPTEAYKRRYPLVDIITNDAEKSLAIKSSLFGTDGEFSIEELLSMQLKNIKANAESMAGKGFVIEDAVITVPAFYTADERIAVEHAANLAGLKVMGLISDGLAVGLNYATPRTFPNIDEGEKPEYHLVYDMGAGSTTASVLRFQARTVKDVGKRNKTIQEVGTMGTGFDRTLGGDVLNEMIVEDMIRQFVSSSPAKAAGVQPDAVKKHGRTMAKLWREAERLRMVLSANTATTASFEGLYDDVDFKYKLARSEFEELTTSYAARVGVPIVDALANAKLSWSDLNSVVLHGGAVRTPFVQKLLEASADDPAKLRSNVNADEAAVFGAAFKAASFSPSFRVKEIKSNDAAVYGASLIWNASGKERRQQVFAPTSQVGTTKQVPFNKLEDFDVTVVQTVPEGDSQVDREIFALKAENVTASVNELVKSYGCEKEGIKTQLSVRLSPFTVLPEVVSGSVSCESEVLDKKGGVVDDVKGFFGFGGKKDQKPVGENETESETASADATESVSEASTPSGEATASPSSSASASAIKEKKPVKKVHTIPLKLQVRRVGGKQVTESTLASVQERLANFDLSDQGRRMREEVYNVLEGFTYRARDMLADEGFISVSTKAQREAIEQQLSSTSDWLYGEGSSAGLDAVKEKLSALQGLVNPIRTRQDETTKRPVAVEALQKGLTQAESVVKVVKDSIDKAAAAASSVAEEIARSATETAAAEESSAMDDDDLEESSTTTTAKPLPTADPSPYSDYDLEDISSLYESAKEWLGEQLAAQEKLTVSDEPALLSNDVNAKVEQLNRVMERILNRAPRKSQRPKSSSSKKSKTAKTAKTKSSTSTTASPNESSSSAAAESTSTHDEL